MLEFSGTALKKIAAVWAATAVLSCAVTLPAGAIPEFANAAPSHHGSIVSDSQIRLKVTSYGRKVENALRHGDPLFVYNQFDARMQKKTPKLKFIKVFEGLISTSPLGDRLGESIRNDGNGSNIYLAEYTWDENIILVVVGYDKQYRISGIFFRAQPALPEDPKAYYLDHADYRLPFNGEWWVYWGGNTDLQNYHIYSKDQRDSYDLGIAKNNSTHSGSGDSNTDYYCFGQPILSPVNGKVVEAVGDVKDNLPRTLNAHAPAGNHVIISCGNGEYLVMAHFKDHTLKVHKGDKVARGEFIADCGNSGASAEPHLHIHLQNVSTIENATSLPLYFEHFVRDGQKVSLGLLQQGQYVHK